MAKGFGTATKRHLGNVLLLCPTANAYAANHSLDGEGEEFIGVTNMLEMARVWTKKSAVREAIIRQFKNQVHQCLMIIHRIPQKGFDSQDIFEDDD